MKWSEALIIKYLSMMTGISDYLMMADWWWLYWYLISFIVEGWPFCKYYDTMTVKSLIDERPTVGNFCGLLQKAGVILTDQSQWLSWRLTWLPIYHWKHYSSLLLEADLEVKWWRLEAAYGTVLKAPFSLVTLLWATILIFWCDGSRRLTAVFWYLFSVTIY